MKKLSFDMIETTGNNTCTLYTEEELKKILTPEQYDIVRKNGTEMAYMNEYYNNHEPGLYVDIVSGEPLFTSLDKYDSGTGWPSFSKPIKDNAIIYKRDLSHEMDRVEVRSTAANSHLGHVFNDGPEPYGLRYCINSASLKFVPAGKLEEEGYGKYKYLFMDTKTAYFGAGCFWGVEEYFSRVNGVLNTDVGYSGGVTVNPTYNDVCSSDTGHAEVVKVIYDPKVITYAELLEHFFKIHDPTTPNKQGNDVGTQYRSIILYTDDEQRKTALDYIQKLVDDKMYHEKIVTELKSYNDFYLAEEYHQDYLKKNPGGYCHIDFGNLK